MRQLRLRGRRRSEDGASAVEYGLLVLGIAAVVFVAILGLGGVTKGMFSKTCTTYAGKAAPSNVASCDS